MAEIDASDITRRTAENFDATEFAAQDL